MKRPVFLKPLLILVLLLSFAQCGRYNDHNLDANKFKTPAEDKKIHTWWHWLDGAITKEGITRDLEAMKKQGICQATILNVGLFNGKDFGVKAVKFNSPEWFSMFEWALKEANRLGIKIGVHNCDGWSSTGGPWITPEMSMKQYTWTKTVISGGRDIKIKLQKPQAVENLYKDVAVFAVKTDVTLNSFHSANPSLSINDTVEASALTDGCPISGINVTRGTKLLISFQIPLKVNKIAIHLRRSFMWRNPDDFTTDFSLSASQDNMKFHSVSEFTIKGLNHTETVAIPVTSARYFRLEIKDFKNTDAWYPLLLSEVELLNADEKPLYCPVLPSLLEKTGSIKPRSAGIFNVHDTTELAKSPGAAFDVINLKSRMSEDGTLQWIVPEGNWSILRFGYTSTGAHNSPATHEGIGLECDKMDTAAVNLHYRNFPEKLISSAGKFTGNTFKFLLIDSWECGYQNWTGNFQSEFLKLRKYEMHDYLPVLCGESIGNGALSEAFLFDFRKTIADLIEVNYYKHYSELVHKDKLELHAEVIYGNTNYPSLDILKTTQYIDLPMYEFWTSQNPKTGLIEYSPTALPELNFPAAAAIDYNKPMMASEAYTGFAHYSESPDELKPFGDRAFCAGINQIILHSYVHQPLEKKPGMTLGPYASHFNRNNLYFQFISEWFNYQSRIEYVLQQGITQTDVMYYLGDQLPQFYEYNSSNTIPFGYNLNACNFDVLKNKIIVKDGKLILSGVTSYGLLCLPDHPFMNLETLRRLEELIKQGAIVYGPKPELPLSASDLVQNRSGFIVLADKIWGLTSESTVTENNYGKGKVFWGMSISSVLKKINLLPDFETNRPDSGNFLFIHKKIGTSDAYFVCNQQNKPLDRECIFKVENKSPELWNPENGEVKQPAIFTNENGRVRIPLHFSARESYIIVFKNKKINNNIVKVTVNGKQLFPSIRETDSLSAVPEAYFTNKGIEVYSSTPGNASFVMENNKTVDKALSASEEFPINNFTGSISFENFYNASIPSVEINSLASLTEFENPDIRYFSGNARYVIKFKAGSQFVNAKERLFLDLGALGSVAEISLNGSKLGTAWKPNTLLQIDGLIKADNVLEVTVANVYRNRFIGDYLQYGKIQNLWTSSPIDQFLDKNKPLKPSGLLGPLKVILLQPVSL